MPKQMPSQRPTRAATAGLRSREVKCSGVGTAGCGLIAHLQHGHPALADRLGRRDRDSGRAAMESMSSAATTAHRNGRLRVPSHSSRAQTDVDRAPGSASSTTTLLAGRSARASATAGPRGRHRCRFPSASGAVCHLPSPGSVVEHVAVERRDTAIHGSGRPPRRRRGSDTHAARRGQRRRRAAPDRTRCRGSGPRRGPGSRGRRRRPRGSSRRPAGRRGASPRPITAQGLPCSAAEKTVEKESSARVMRRPSRRPARLRRSEYGVRPPPRPRHRRPCRRRAAARRRHPLPAGFQGGPGVGVRRGLDIATFARTWTACGSRRPSTHQPPSPAAPSTASTSTRSAKTRTKSRAVTCGVSMPIWRPGPPRRRGARQPAAQRSPSPRCAVTVHPWPAGR